MRLFFLLSPLFIVLPFSSSAQYWQKLNGPSGGGGIIQSGKQGFLFYINNLNELYRSSDNGNHWQLMPTSPANSSSRPVVVCPDGNLYASKPAHLYRSADNGETWDLISAVVHLSACGLPNGTLLAGSPNGMLRSVNNGQSWTTVASDAKSTDRFSYNPHNGDVYAWKKSLSSGSLGTIWRSSDDGESWSVMLESANLIPYQFAYSPSGTIYFGAKEVIWRSLDSAATWASLGPTPPNAFRDVSVAVSASGRLFASESANSKYSDDEGATWNPLIDSGRNGLYNLSAVPNGPVFGVRADGGLQRSDDDGENWAFSAEGIGRATVLDMEHLSETQLLARTGDGLFYSKDSGISWELIWDKVRGSVFPGPHLSHTHDGSWYLWDGFKIVKFGQEGQTFSYLQIPPAVDNSSLHGFWVSPVSGKIFMQFQQGFFASTDEGQSWSKSDQVFVPSLRGLLFMPDGSILFFMSNGIYKSTDDGQTLVKISNLKFNEVPFLANNGSIYGIMQSWPNKLYASHDGGLTWSGTTVNHNYSVYSPVVNNAGIIFVYDQFSQRVLQSVDGGHSFNPLQAINNQNGNIKGISLNQSQHLFVLSHGDGVRSSNVPTTQQKLLKGSSFHNVDGSCNLSTADSILTGRIIRATRNGQHVYGYSNSFGSYTVPVSAGNYTVSIVPPNNYWGNCSALVAVPNNNDIGIVDSANVALRVLTECPFADVDVSSPFLRRCFESTIYVKYSNSGTIPAADARIDITLDSLLEFNSSSIPLFAQNGHTLSFILGDVPVNAQGQFTLKVTPSCNAELGYIHCIKAHFYPDELCPPVTGARVKTSAVCLGDSIQLRIENIGTEDMEQPKSWTALNYYAFGPAFGVVDHGQFQLGVGETFTKNIEGGYQRLRFFASQSDHYPFSTVSTTDIFGCGTPPGEHVLNIIENHDGGPFVSQFCARNIGAYDPNDKQGFPEGLSEKGYIEETQDLQYLIRFQNTGTDTAFNVTILDTLSHLLDPATLRLGVTSHACEMKLLPSGVLMLVFEHIMLPDSNINEPASHGFVQFKIAQKPANPVGASILNRAAIYFDFNPPVITNQTLHTVGLPQSSGSTTPKTDRRAISISPNPFRSSARLTLNDEASETQSYYLELFDQNGKLVRSNRFVGSQFSIEREQLATGPYQLVLKTADGKVVGSGVLLAQ